MKKHDQMERSLSLWYVIMTKHRQEELASEQLVNQGFKTFLPLRQMPDKLTKEGDPIFRPLFGGYIFASFNKNDRWGRILSTRGVKGFLGISEERPRPLPFGLVESLKAAQIEEDIIPEGTTLDISAGTFAGQQGICEMDDGQRIKLLVSLLGKDISIVLHRHEVRKQANG